MYLSRYANKPSVPVDELFFMKFFMPTKYAGDFHQLVVVVLTMEERLFAEDHPGKHAPQAPDVQGVVVELKIHLTAAFQGSPCDQGTNSSGPL